MGLPGMVPSGGCGTRRPAREPRDHRISTLRRYVEALGGELEITAVFPSTGSN